MELFEPLATHPWLFAGVVFVFALVVGSFLNVVIHRLPIMLEREWKAECTRLDGREPEQQPVYNLLRPRSACVSCGKTITAAENIPVIGWLVLRGRCSGCGTKISPRYPVVELFTAVLSAAVALRFGFAVETAAALVLTWALIALSGIDIDHQILPDSITLPMLWLGIVLSLFQTTFSGEVLFITPSRAILGAVLGYLTLWSVYHLFRLATGKEGMGYGDFKLLALLGAWLGPAPLPLIILLSAFVGAAVGVTLIVLRRQDRNIPIPYGPYLAAAGWIALMWGDEIISTYLQVAGI